MRKETTSIRTSNPCTFRNPPLLAQRHVLQVLVAMLVFLLVTFVPPAGAASKAGGARLARPHEAQRISGFTIERIPVSYSNTDNLTCSKEMTCTIFGHIHGQAVAWQTDDGGVNWSVEHLPNGLYGFVDGTCPVKAKCFAFADNAAGNAVALTEAGGGSWRTTPLLGVWCQTMFYVSDPVRNIPVAPGQT